MTTVVMHTFETKLLYMYIKVIVVMKSSIFLFLHS